MDRHADSYRWKVPVNSVSRRLGLSLKRSGNACTDLQPIRPGIYSVCTMVRCGRGLTQPALVITCIELGPTKRLLKRWRMHATSIGLENGTAEAVPIVGSRPAKHVELEVGVLESASPLCHWHPNKATCHRWAIHELGQTSGTGEVAVGGWICARNVTTCTAIDFCSTARPRN